MAYNPLTTSEIETGEPVKNSTLTKIKDNFTDHESRIVDLEDGSAVVYPPIEMSVYGYYGDQGAADGWCKYSPNFNLTITGVFLEIDTAGSAGTTEIDIKKKSGVGAYATIFTTRPSVAYTAGNDARSSNGVLDVGNVTVLAGDILRLDTTSVQTNGHSFRVRIDYTKN